MERDDFLFFRQYIYQKAGITIDLDKQYLVIARLAPLLEEFQLETFRDLSEQIRVGARPDMQSKVIDALTINETFFFRDIHVFETLKQKILPEIIEKNKERKTLKIWCGASSSGQEPYSIAMILKEMMPDLKNWTFQFVASDISLSILKRAEEGIYTQFEINRGLPLPYLAKYFSKYGNCWQIKDEIRELVKFKQINLAESWSLSGMDIIFLRNVLIYFDAEMKKTVLEHVKMSLHPDGWLFLGCSETLLGLNHQFERVEIPKVNCFKLSKNNK